MMTKPNIYSLFGLSGLLILALLAAGCGKEPMAADTLFGEKGTYTAPNKTLSVEIDDAEKGQLRYRFVFANGYKTEYQSFPADKAWFMCFDGGDRLWIHIPDVRTVYWYSSSFNQLVPHDMMPPTQSDWQLMPKNFRDKLPEKFKPKQTPRGRR